MIWHWHALRESREPGRPDRCCGGAEDRSRKNRASDRECAPTGDA
jgi:hypothetical protein